MVGVISSPVPVFRRAQALYSIRSRMRRKSWTAPQPLALAGVSITITAPVSFGMFETSQVTGEFVFVGDNNVGPKVRVEALNAILTPNGTLTLLDSDATEPAELPMTLDVYLDSYGNTAQFYWNETTAWVPVLA
jgi:hypothetical protein